MNCFCCERRFELLNKRYLADRRWSGLTGIGRYSRELLSRISFFVDGYIDGNNPTSFLEILRGLGYYGKQNVIYSPGYMPLLGARNQFITIHDLILLRSGVGKKNSKAFFNVLIKPRVKDGSIRVITVSEQSRLEIAEWVGFCPSRIEVVKNGLSSGILRASNSNMNNRIKRSLVFVGNMKKHKNFQLFAAAVNLLPGTWFISLIGPDLDSTVFNNRHQIQKHYGISDAELAKIYLQSEILINTSSFEGFGMPFLEAGYLGCRIVHLGVLPTAFEILGNDSKHTYGSMNPAVLSDVIINTSSEIMDLPFEPKLHLANDYSWDKSAQHLGNILLKK